VRENDSVLRYRYLFGQMVRRELRQKYKGSALGVLWYLVNPLVLMGAYWLLFGKLLPGASVPDYPLFLMVGLLVWLFFSQSLLSAAGSLVMQASLVGRVRFPRETIPASVVAVQLVTFAILLGLLTPVMLAVRGTLRPALALLPVLVCALLGFVLGVALVVAALHAYFRDVEPILGAALLPWFFLTPIFFDVSRLPGIRAHHTLGELLNWANPVAPFVRAFREVLYAGVVPGATTLAYVLVAAPLALATGLILFRRMQGELAVVV
jgi:ABC-type polysaccharide/polyol phosphate export permease